MEGFLSKIQLERRVLRAVNSRYGSPALAGVSLPAVGSWVAADPSRRGHLEGRLRQIADLLSSLCERSAERPGLNEGVESDHVEQAIASIM